MKDKTAKEYLHELADREAIKDCLFRYCRGVDRMDRELLESVYWPEATDNHVVYSGSAKGYIDFVWPMLSTMNQTMHKLGNIYIELYGEKSVSETYFDAYHQINDEDGHTFDLVLGGRYLDIHEKRDDVWKIRERAVTLDWFRLYPDSGDWGQKPLGMETTPGGRKPIDPSYQFFNQ